MKQCLDGKLVGLRFPNAICSGQVVFVEVYDSWEVEH
jgi:hypothetical protein